MAIDNIEIAKQLKKLQEDLNDLVESQNKSLKSQLSISQQIADTLSQQTTNSKETVDNLSKTQETLEKAAESASKLGAKGTMNKMTDALKKGHKEGDGLVMSLKKAVKLMPGFAAFSGIWTGFTAGITGTVNALKLFGSGTMTALEALGQFALAVISFPFKILSNLIDFASQGGGDNSLRQALEDIRKEFGDLRKSSAKAIIDISRGMKGELANTGLSVYRVFGRLAERLKTIAEYAKNMGNVFANIAPEFVNNAEVLGAYIKGLHLTEAGQKGFATRSYALGISLRELSREVANYSVQLADEFGQSAAQVSEDVGEMMADFEHFGGIAPQILTQISVYARRLGVEVKGLLGVIDQFDNFEDAARSASQLTQAFGLQLDALELLKAEDPAERTEMIRKSFFAAGRSIENMTRQERALLAQQTGLEASTLDLVFSAKNQALSYDQVKKKSESARKSQLTQAESLQKIAGAIERLVRSGATGSGGFFERFIQGFERGIIRSREFRQLMINIRMALRDTYMAGIAVGRAFVDMFPGVQQLLQGLSDLFDRNRFREMTKSLRNIFREFFESLTSTSGRDSFKNLMERLKTMFWNYFNGSTPAGRGILEGVRKFSKAAAVIIAGLVREAAKGITTGIRFITDLLSGRKSLGGGAEAGGALGFVMDLFEPIIEAIKEAWPPLVEALTRLWDEEIWPRVRNFLMDHAGTIALVLFGPAVVSSVARGIAGAAAGMFAKGLTQGLAAGVSEFASSGTVRSSLSKGVSSVFSRGSSGVAAGITSAGEAAVAAQVSPITGAEVARMALIATVIAVGIVGIVMAIEHLASFMKENQITPTQMLTASLVMIAAAAVIIELGGAVALIAPVGEMIKAQFAGFAIGMGAVALTAVALGVGIVQLVEALGDIRTEQLTGAVAAIGAGAAFFVSAAAVLAIATAVGSAFIASAGVGALAAVAGFAAIATVTGLMVEQVKNIINEVNDLHIPDDFDRKFDIFTGALEAITTFGDLVARISESSSHSSLWGWISGSGADDQIAVLGELNSFMERMGNQMVSLVRDVIGMTATLSSSEEDLKKAEIFGSILSTIGELMSSLQGPSEVLSAGGGVLSYIIGDNVAENLSNYSIFIENMGVSLGNLLRDVVSSLSGPLANANITGEMAKGFETIGNILTVLGTFGRNMITVVSSTFSNLHGDELAARSAEVAGAVGSLLSGIFSGGSTGLIEQMGTLITQLIASMSNISEADATRLSRVAPVLTAAFEAIAQIGQTVSDLSNLAAGIPAEARGTALGTVNALVQNMLGGVSEIASSLLTSVRDVFSGMSRGEISALKTGIEAFKGMIEAVATLPATLSSFQESLAEDASLGAELDTMMARITNLTVLFADTDSGIPRLIRAIATSFNNLPEITGDPSTVLDQVSKGMSSVRELSTLDFEDIRNNIESNAALIRDGAFTQLGSNLRAMIEEVNSIATDLGSLPVVDINTNLKALSGRLGLGDSEEITIRNRDFNIEVAVNVHIDAQELERTLIERPNSRIVATKGRAGT